MSKDISRIVREVYDIIVAQFPEGELSPYLRDLVEKNPEKYFWARNNSLGISVCPIGEEPVLCGASEVRVDGQSAMKVPLQMCALEMKNQDFRKKVGIQPSNLSYKDYATTLEGKITNSYYNLGALFTSSVVTEERLQSVYQRLFGERLAFDQDVLESERKSISNRILAMQLVQDGFIPSLERMEQALETYFKACSSLVTVAQLSRAGALLADPCQTVFDPEHVKLVFAAMIGCGLYSEAEFSLELGMPAKSSVSGIIWITVPGMGGIGILSPCLNPDGNSTLGKEVMRHLAKKLGWSIWK